MTTCSDPRETTRVIFRGTIDYLDAVITSDTELTNQPVHFSLDDRATWHQATWTGDPGTTRTASLLLDEDNTPTPGKAEILVRVTGSPTSPIELAGTVIIR